MQAYVNIIGVHRTGFVSLLFWLLLGIKCGANISLLRKDQKVATANGNVLVDITVSTFAEKYL
jgi:hypothetical protein